MRTLFITQPSVKTARLEHLHDCNPVVLNLIGGTEPHKFHTCIHRTIRSWKNKICREFFFIAQNLLPPNPRNGLIEPRLRTTGLRGRDMPPSSSLYVGGTSHGFGRKSPGLKRIHRLTLLHTNFFFKSY